MGGCRVIVLCAHWYFVCVVTWHGLVLSCQVFNSDINYHVKNRSRRVDSQIWQRRLSGQVFAVSPSFTSFKDPKGWLVELMNTVSVLMLCL